MDTCNKWRMITNSVFNDKKGIYVYLHKICVYAPARVCVDKYILVNSR